MRTKTRGFLPIVQIFIALMGLFVICASGAFAEIDPVTGEEIPVVEEPTPTIEYVFADVDLVKLSKFIDLKESLNMAKAGLTNASIVIGKAKSEVSEKYLIVKDQLTEDMQAKFDAYLINAEQVKAAADQLIAALEVEWEAY